MKRYIACMSLDRKRAKQRIESFSYEISSNLLKLVAYPDDTATNHWIGELATWLSDINDITVKPKNKKFSYSDYEELIFGDFGTTRTDVKVYIDSWLVSNRISNKYIEFEVSESLVDKLYLFVSKLKDKILPTVCTLNTLSRVDFLNTISIIHKSILQ